MKEIHLDVRDSLPSALHPDWLEAMIRMMDPFQGNSERRCSPCWEHAVFPSEGEKPLDAEEIWGDSPT